MNNKSITNTNDPVKGEIKLNRKRINVKMYRAQMTIRVRTPADLYLSILKLTSEFGYINYEILNRKFGFSVGMAKTAIIRCVWMNLLKYNSQNSYVLTKDGQDAIQLGYVFTPESGEYRIYITDDALIPQRVLTIQRLSRNLKENQSKDTQSIKLNLDGTRIQNFVVAKNGGENGGFIDSEEITIEECKEWVQLEKDSIRCDIDIGCKISPNSQLVELVGQISYKIGKSEEMITKDFKKTVKNLAQNLTYSIVFSDLLKLRNIHQDFDYDYNALRMEFAENELNTDYINFLKVLKFENPSIPNLGKFSDTQLSVAILPKNDSACYAWEMYLLKRKITGICPLETYNSLKIGIESDMQVLSGNSVPLPNLEDFLQELMNNSKEKGSSKFGPRHEIYWNLQLPIDLPINLLRREK